MDTPERKQIGTPLSKFEDSPVFKYINSLSPIKPVKSVNNSQTFNSLSFTGIPSVFTSPHVTDFKFLRRHQPSDQFKYRNPADNENKPGTSEGVMGALQISDNYIVSSESSHGESFFEKLSQCLKFDNDCLPGNTMPCSSGCATDLDGPSTSFVSFVKEPSETILLQEELHIQEICHTKLKHDESSYDWDQLISDSTDLLFFSSPDGTKGLQDSLQNSVDPVKTLRKSLMSDTIENDSLHLQSQSTMPVGSHKHWEAEHFAIELKEIDEALDSLVDTSLVKETDTSYSEIDKTIQARRESLTDISSDMCMMKNQIPETTDVGDGKCVSFTYKPVLNLQSGGRRRCLVYEMPGEAHNTNLNNVSPSSSSSSLQSGENFACNNMQLVRVNPGNDNRACILPGIGLHLNSLASTSEDPNIANHKDMSATLDLSVEQQPSTNSLALICSERDANLIENSLEVASVEDFNQGSPRNKRFKLEEDLDPGSCKRCNCKKSKCLKLYCECFAASVYCVEPCSCHDCFNKPIHEDTVLATRKQIESRNPLAFAPKVVNNLPEAVSEPNKTPSSARHKRGCNCKKSSCLKKYCECYQGGVGCSMNCRCEGCKNAFGKKEGCTETGEMETGAGEDIALITQCKEDEILETAHPITPVQIYRSSAGAPFHIGKGDLEKCSEGDEEMPEILKTDCGRSPNGGIETLSPNVKKRVSSPQCGMGLSPSRRRSRKLILQSIPPFQSLAQN